MLSTAYIAKFPRFLSILLPTRGKTFRDGGFWCKLLTDSGVRWCPRRVPDCRLPCEWRGRADFARTLRRARFAPALAPSLGLLEYKPPSVQKKRDPIQPLHRFISTPDKITHLVKMSARGSIANALSAQNSARVRNSILIFAQVSGGEMFNPSKRGGDDDAQISAAVTYKEIREERDTTPSSPAPLFRAIYQQLLRPCAHFDKFRAHRA